MLSESFNVQRVPNISTYRFESCPPHKHNTHNMKKGDINYLRELSELNKLDSKPTSLAFRDLGKARDKLVKSIVQTFSPQQMKKGDIVQNKVTHQAFEYVGQYDDERSIIKDAKGETWVLPNIYLQRDWDRIFIQYITKKLRALWEMVQPKKRFS